MLLPTDPFGLPRAGAAIFFTQERDMPHGYFGDRDAGHRVGSRRTPAACGLFGRLGDDPPLMPRNDRGTPRPQPDRPNRRQPEDRA